MLVLLNSIPLKTLRSASIIIQEATHAPISIRDHEGTLRDAYGFIILKMKIGSIWTETKFHIIRENPGYDMILGRTWIHAEKRTTYKAPPTTHLLDEIFF